MKRHIRKDTIVAALVGFMITSAVPATAFGQTTPADLARGKATFNRCAACHLSNGQGIPGSIPPLDKHIATFATNAEGRKYIVSVLTGGLTGQIKVGDKTYNGFMPAQNLSDEQISSVLNYVLASFGPANGKFKAFSTAEVTSIRSQNRSLTAQTVRKMRPEKR